MVYKMYVVEEGLGFIIWVIYFVERLVVIIVLIFFFSIFCSQGKDFVNDFQGLVFCFWDVLEYKNLGYESDYGEEVEYFLQFEVLVQDWKCVCDVYVV